MALSIVYWQDYVEGSKKLARKSEACIDASPSRVKQFLFDPEQNVVMAQVQASMRDKCYKVQVFLDDNYELQMTRCDCPMTNFKCHHVAAALLYGYRHVSKTDVKCTWIKRPKSALPKQITAMSSLYPPRKPNYRALASPFSQEDRLFFHKELNSLGRFIALNWILSPEPASESTAVPLVEDLLLNQHYVNSETPMQWLREKLIVNPQQVSETVIQTTGQRKNPIWAAVRKYRLTASNFGQIIGAIERKKFTASLKKRLLSAYNLDKIASIQWGVAHEETAIKTYSLMFGVSVEETGAWLHESGVLAASPDGIANDVLLEVKCPYVARDMTVKQAAASVKDFCLGITDGELFLKEKHDYFDQVQGQLHICCKEKFDFVVWTSVDMKVIRISKSPEWSQNITKMIDFYFTSFIPNLGH